MFKSIFVLIFFLTACNVQHNVPLSTGDPTTAPWIIRGAVDSTQKDEATPVIFNKSLVYVSCIRDAVVGVKQGIVVRDATGAQIA